MKRMLFIAAALLSTQAFAKQYLVKYKNYNTYSQLTSFQFAANREGKMLVLDHHDTGSLLKVDIEKKNEAQVLAQLLSNPGVQYVVPNFKLKAYSAPVEASALKEQWAITKINAEKAWARAGNKGSRNVLLAVIDTGVDYKHQNLAPNMVPGYDFRENDNDPMDKTSSQNPGHGTHCAGIIGATGVVDGGIVGMSPEVSIMPLRFLGEDGSGDLNSAIKAIDYAIEKHVQVISASWGANVSRSQAQPLLEAIKRADDKGVIFIAAASNEGRNNDSTEVYPANAGFPNTITVAASGSKDEKPSWSNYGKGSVHLSAPGLNIMSTLPGNKYGNLSGTSMATPLVSGLVAFLKSQDSSLTGAQARALLQTTGAKVNIETACDCRIDAAAATEAILGKQMWLVPAAGTYAKGETVNMNVMNGKAPFKYSSSAANVMSVNDQGVLTAAADGTAVITVTDANGKSVSSLNFFVGKKSAPQEPPQEPGTPEDPGNPGGPGDGSCPLGDQSLCDIICQIKPDLPFCQK